MNIATGAMNILRPKLVELVAGEYKLQKGVEEEIEELEKELTYITAALHKVAGVPRDQLDEQVKIWADEARQLSYDIEDAVDIFMSRSKEHGHTHPSFGLKRFIDKARDWLRNAKTNHQIDSIIKDIMDQVKKVSERRARYKIDNIAARPTLESVDPRLETMYRKATELVGIGGPKNELSKRILQQDWPSRQQTKIISIVGFGGLGKTTLANSLLQDFKSKFDCSFFVSVSLNHDIKKILKNILLQLDAKEHSHIDETSWEIRLLIDKIIGFLKNKRCLCVIDDLWKKLPWDTIKLALQDGNHGSKIIITTRNKDVAEHVGGDIYELKHLSDNDSRELFYKRVLDSRYCPTDLRKVAEKILKKCGGVPLAIITIASLLATKPRCLVEWEKVNNSIGSGFQNDPHMDKMNMILSLSYNDLPFHLKTCLLSLSKYPEDHVIRKDVLIWSWMAEGFIAPAAGSTLQEIGERYFNELINRSLLQPVGARYPFDLGDNDVYACQLHDMVLEIIIKLSAEEGFVTTSLSDGEQARAPPLHRRDIIRRLSLHKSSNTNASLNKIKELSKVRSLDVFGHAGLMPTLSRFRVLRLLQLEDCSGLDKTHLNDLSNLYLLKFLRLKGLKVTELPESIGNLESIETLDIRDCEQVIMLPLSFGKLDKLVRLHAKTVQLPDAVFLDNMKSLQELVGILPTLHSMTEIGKLRELKVLQLVSIEKSSNELINTYLQMDPSLLQVLMLQTSNFCSPDFVAQIPSGLRIFICSGYFQAFPNWINMSLACLTVLSIKLWQVRIQPEHLDRLAELPSLRILRLQFQGQRLDDDLEKLIIPSSRSAFPCLTDLRIVTDFPVYLKFQPGSMQKLRRLCLTIYVKMATTRSYKTTNDYNYGFENLPSLRHVIMQLSDQYKYIDESQHAIIRKRINDHPNNPSLDLSFR